MLTPEKLTELVSPGYVGIRQTDMSFVFEACMEFCPNSDNEEAGIVILQSNEYHYRFVKMQKDGANVIRLIRCREGKEEILHENIIENDKQNRQVKLRLSAQMQDLSFSYCLENNIYHALISGVDARMLSTDVAGGFVGNTLGLYCSSNGIESKTMPTLTGFRIRIFRYFEFNICILLFTLLCR